MKKFNYPFIVVCTVSIYSAALHAAEWNVSKSVDLSAIHSDNIAHANNNAEESDLVFEVRPSLGISGKGSRLQLDFNYSLEVVLTDGDNGRDEIEDFHFLNATATLEAIEDNLFVDFEADAGVTSVNSNNFVQDLYTSSNNRTQSYSYKISPYYRYHFGSAADAEIRYSFDSLENENGNTSDSETQRWDFSLTSGRQFRSFNWVLSANQSELEYSNNARDESSAVNADFQFRINRQFTADFGIGYEENEYNNALRQYSNTDGETWTVGTTWTPHPRMTMKLAYVDRFYGGNWDMDLKYRHRKSVLTASYSTSVTNSRNEQLGAISTTSTNINDETVFIGDQDLFLDPLVPTLNNENIVQSQFRLAYEYSSRRTTFRFNTTYSERDYQTQVLSTEDLNTRVSLTRKLTPLTSLNTGINWLNREDVSAQSEEELVTINLGVSTEIGRNSDFSVDLQRSENEDSTGANDYDENRVTASLAMTF